MTEMVLKPCPFCGGTPTLDDYREKPAGAWVLVHRGRGCPVSPQIRQFATDEAAFTAWNTRASSPVGEGVREKVAKALGASEGVTWDDRTVWMRSVNDDQCASERFYRMADIAIALLSTGEANQGDAG